MKQKGLLSKCLAGLLAGLMVLTPAQAYAETTLDFTGFNGDQEDPEYLDKYLAHPEFQCYLCRTGNKVLIVVF
ncbi:MAG: hypothetical protein K6E19_04275 [Lachnospiraceae bacterium]|nr:hypothetical protein [Lachnospiraceae bacterium]